MSDRGVNAAISRLVWERTELEAEVEALRAELAREALLADEAMEENKRLRVGIERVAAWCEWQSNHYQGGYCDGVWAPIKHLRGLLDGGRGPDEDADG